METMKCSKCDEVKPLTEFGNNTSTNTGGDGFKRPECKKCTSDISKGKRKAWKMAGKPSAPPIGTNCDCCGKPQRPSTKLGSKLKPLVFDHGHISLNFRGWLCQSCNRGWVCWVMMNEVCLLFFFILRRVKVDQNGLLRK